jgi:activator of HSP90 ATPase
VTDQPTTTPVDRVALLRQARFSLYAGPVTNISRRLNLGVPPHEVYQALIDPQRHAALTGHPAEIGDRAGDPVVLAGGRLTGLLMEVLADRHVVFALRSGDSWPARHYATTTFMVRPDDGGSTLVLFVQGVPEELAEEITALWQQEYLDKLTAAFPASAP